MKSPVAAPNAVLELDGVPIKQTVEMIVGGRCMRHAVRADDSAAALSKLPLQQVGHRPRYRISLLGTHQERAVGCVVTDLE